MDNLDFPFVFSDMTGCLGFGRWAVWDGFCLETCKHTEVFSLPNSNFGGQDATAKSVGVPGIVLDYMRFLLERHGARQTYEEPEQESGVPDSVSDLFAFWRCSCR